MKNTIREELKGHVLDLINDGVLTNDNKEDWHFHAFNEDYYIIGYFQASEWLKKHGIDPFEAISICQEYEIDTFGDCGKVYGNSEIAVNMLAYIYGEELLSEIDADNIEELKEAVEG